MENIDKNKFKTLVIEGVAYSTLFTKKFENRKIWQTPNNKIITAYISGTIIKCSVTVGQKVKVGDEIVILEAMKMKNHIISHFEGVVKTINVKEGQQIPRGYIIIDFK